MIIFRCDRCGKEKAIKKMFSLPDEIEATPKYSITRIVDGELQILNLCIECENAFDKFLGSEFNFFEKEIIEKN